MDLLAVKFQIVIRRKRVRIETGMVIVARALITVIPNTPFGLV